MNIVFYLLVVLGLVFLWLCLTFLFKPIGKVVKNVVQDAVDVMTDEDSDE